MNPRLESLRESPRKQVFSERRGGFSRQLQSFPVSPAPLLGPPRPHCEWYGSRVRREKPSGGERRRCRPGPGRRGRRREVPWLCRVRASRPGLRGETGQQPAVPRAGMLGRGNKWRRFDGNMRGGGCNRASPWQFPQRRVDLRPRALPAERRCSGQVCTAGFLTRLAWGQREGDGRGRWSVRPAVDERSHAVASF